MIYAYEIELKITEKSSRRSRLVTRLEHAYTLSDALMQAAHHALTDVDISDVDVRYIRIGPPEQMIRDFAAQSMDSVLTKVGQRVRLDPNRQIDAVGVGGCKATSNIKS